MGSLAVARSAGVRCRGGGGGGQPQAAVPPPPGPHTRPPHLCAPGERRRRRQRKRKRKADRELENKPMCCAIPLPHHLPLYWFPIRVQVSISQFCFPFPQFPLPAFHTQFPFPGSLFPVSVSRVLSVPRFSFFGFLFLASASLFCFPFYVSSFPRFSFPSSSLPISDICFLNSCPIQDEFPLPSPPPATPLALLPTPKLTRVVP